MSSGTNDRPQQSVEEPELPNGVLQKYLPTQQLAQYMNWKEAVTLFGGIGIGFSFFSKTRELGATLLAASVISYFAIDRLYPEMHRTRRLPFIYSDNDDKEVR